MNRQGYLEAIEKLEASFIEQREALNRQYLGSLPSTGTVTVEGYEGYYRIRGFSVDKDGDVFYSLILLDPSPSTAQAHLDGYVQREYHDKLSDDTIYIYLKLDEGYTE